MARASIFTFLVASAALASQPKPAALEADFSRHLQEWDGFGVNYVEVPQTRDYKTNPQEYGGMSALSEDKRRQLLELFWGDDGLRPGVVKMFADVWMEPVNDNTDPEVIDASRFDHETTTKWMRMFVREGVKRTRARGGGLKIITTLYGPPAWATRQKFVRGRDLDPAMKKEVAEYLIAWVKFLREKEGFPVSAISLHNEGEDFSRWPVDGMTAGHPTHDYNLYWPPSQVVDFLSFMRPMMDRMGLKEVALANGEPTNWYRFWQWGHAPEIARSPEALKGLGLITSHGFAGGTNQWYGDHSSNGVDLLRLAKPGLHAWTTSMTWGKMNMAFLDDIRQQIYSVKVNAVIPWAAVQTSNWVGGDPNPGTAVRVIEDCGCFQVLPGYWNYKQVSRAGQPGMRVAAVRSDDPGLRIMAFASNGTKHPDSFVVINTTWEQKTARIAVAGTRAASFKAFRSSLSEKYAPAGDHAVSSGAIEYRVPPNSATTFFAN
ncbi:MAG: hypothetical protein HXY18_16330 [Bryobacteraceae bacterium]|nr:hypothetical protein [Bryobacteraceae bacterium]